MRYLAFVYSETEDLEGGLEGGLSSCRPTTSAQDQSYSFQGLMPTVHGLVDIVQVLDCLTIKKFYDLNQSRIKFGGNEDAETIFNRTIVVYLRGPATQRHPPSYSSAKQDH